MLSQGHPVRRRLTLLALLLSDCAGQSSSDVANPDSGSFSDAASASTNTASTPGDAADVARTPQGFADANLRVDGPADSTTGTDATVTDGGDANAATDGIGADGPEDAIADASTDAAGLAPCETSRDVFYVETIGPPGPPFSQQATNLNSNWSFDGNPFKVFVDQAGRGNFAWLTFWGTSNAPPAPGTYPVGSSGDGSGPGFDVSMGGVGWGILSGSFTVLDFSEADGTAASLDSFSMLFDVNTSGSTSNLEERGCLRYARGPAPNSTGTDASFAALQPDASSLSPCLAGGYVFYADGENGYPGVSGPTVITGASGTWSAGLNAGGPPLQVQVSAPNSAWQLNAFPAVDGGGLGVGTYQAPGGPNSGAPSIQVVAGGGACTTVPTGTFTISEISGLISVTKLLMSFDLTCGGQGTLRGCVSYGN